MRFLKKEDILQHQVISYSKLAFPGVKYHHSPNEGKRSKFQQFLFKYIGGDRGFSDLIWPEIKLAIELKIKPNKPSKEQEEWLEYLNIIGWTAEVCYDYDSAVKLLEETAAKHGIVSKVRAVKATTKTYTNHTNI
jgi:hypothetical protein